MTRVPLFVEFEGRNVLVIGGGRVGTKRALKFAKAGARVRVLSLDFTEELKEAAEKGLVELIQGDACDESLIRRLIEWADLVVITVNDERVKGVVKGEAMRLRRLINDATNAEETEVVVPFEAEINGVRIAVTTEGLSGIAARRILERIVEVLNTDEELKNFVKTWFKIKEFIKRTINDPRVRMCLYAELDRDDLLNQLARRGLIEEALKYVELKMRQRHDEGGRR